MGEFAEAAESVVMAAEAVPETPTEIAAADATPASSSPDPAPSSDPDPSAPAEASEPTSASRRDASGRFQRTPSTVPYQRFSEVTKQNQTYKAENARLKALETAFGAIKPDHAPQLRAFYERLQSDPARALAAELRDVAKSPQQLAVLKQELADLFAEQKAQEAATPDPEPQPDYETEDGDPVYSAKRQADWMAWRERQMKADLLKELAPALALVQENQQTKAFAQISQQADAHAKSVVTPLLANPVFVQHKAAIRAQYNAYLAQAKTQGREINGELALYRAFSDVLQSVATQAQTTHGRAVAAALQAKPGASALNPARPVAAAAAARPTTFGEAAAKVLGVR